MLLIDAGNSRIKWALTEGQAWQQRGAVERSAAASLQQQFAALLAQDRILVSNVAGATVAQQIVRACTSLGATPEFITSRDQQCGISNNYELPEQLGSDRWAALIAAWQLMHTACLVVHCGTATTIDALSDSGVFLGGLILPGIALMQHSLVQATANLDDHSGKWQAMPRNTADALATGAIEATVGAIQRQYAQLGVPGARCLLAGGAAEQIAPQLPLPLELQDNLVLHGLHIIGMDKNK